jgi:hypothetical protein
MMMAGEQLPPARWSLRRLVVHWGLRRHPPLRHAFSAWSH